MSDSIFRSEVNSALSRESYLKIAADGTAISQNSKELLAHLRIPFQINEDFHFDAGASVSLGGITEPSDIIGEYTGVNGGLVLKKSSNPSAPHDFYPTSGSGNNVVFHTNRHIFGADIQAYCSFLGFGGTTFKGELYAGQQPFYGSAYLYTPTDSLMLGTPTPSTVLKHILGYYAMLLQNISNRFQIGLKFESFDPNTEVEGKDFVTHDPSNRIVQLIGVRSSTGFGGDLKLSTFSVVFNAFLSSTTTLMFNYDHPITEQFTRVDPYDSFNIPLLSDANDDRLTIRMQYKF